MLRPHPEKNLKRTPPPPAEPPQPPIRIILAHPNSSIECARPSRKPPIPWTVIVPTVRRERAFEGLLFGCAIGEAISLARSGIHPRGSLKLFGRSPLQYRFQPGVGITNHRTHAMIMTVQAILESRIDVDNFARRLKYRTSWYQRAFPIHHALSLVRKGSRFGRKTDRDALAFGFADDPLIRSVVLSLLLQGNDDSPSRWFQKNAAVTHEDPRVVHACVLVGFATQIAQVEDPATINVVEILDKLLASTPETDLHALLVIAREALNKRRSVAQFANDCGWSDGIPSNVYAAAVMGIYAWLRYPQSFRKSVEQSAMLGGQCCAVATIAGALSGISLGRKAIPKEWKDRLSFFPYSKQWCENLIDRVRDWPHGVEDIQRVNALPSNTLGQLVRNATNQFFFAVHGLIRIPLRMIMFSLRKKTRK